MNSCTIRLYYWRFMCVPWKQIHVLFGWMIGVLYMFHGNKSVYYSVEWLAIYVCSLGTNSCTIRLHDWRFVYAHWEQIHGIFGDNRVYFLKYAHGFVLIYYDHVIMLLVLCRLKWCIDHILHGCFIAIGANVRLPQCQLTYLGLDKMAAIFQTTFSNAFSWMKICNFFIEISLKFVPKGLINNIPALVQMTRRQAIIWTNFGIFTDAYMQHSASMS